MDNHTIKSDESDKTDDKVVVGFDIDTIKYFLQIQKDIKEKQSLTPEQRSKKLVDVCSNLSNIW